MQARKQKAALQAAASRTDKHQHTSIRHRPPGLPLSSGDPINITKEREVVKRLRGPAPQVRLKSPCRTLTLLAHKQVQTHRPRRCGHRFPGSRCGWQILFKKEFMRLDLLPSMLRVPSPAMQKPNRRKQARDFPAFVADILPPGQYLVITCLTQLLG